MSTRTLLTIHIDLGWCSFPRRLSLIPFLLSMPIRERRALSREYGEWCATKLCDNNLHKFLYILDHYILWAFYCLVAILFGQVKGFSWERPYDFDITGIKITL